MSFERARAVADAVLFEGYALYPYRPSALKNRERLAFGTLFPLGSREVADGAEPWELACELLVEGAESGAVEARLRFLHSEDVREVDLGPVAVRALAGTGPLVVPFRFEGEAAVAGELELSAAPAGDETPLLLRGSVARLTVRARNLSPVTGSGSPRARDGGDGVVTARTALARGEGALALKAPVLLRARAPSLGSAHVLLRALGGGFVSPSDAPEGLRALAATCHNARVWPVLVGEPGARDVVLCSPIILADHPNIAPESPASYFDATEMDELLTLRILTLTEPELREAAASSERVAELIARAFALGPDDLARLHGAVRSLRWTGHDAPPLAARSGDVELRPGARVRLRPGAGRGSGARARTDVLDLALAGCTATVVSIEQDVENRTFVTVIVDDDPGRDLGAQGWPGHRFFFLPEEVEPLASRDVPRSRPRVLVAGIGNIFLGDDAFGVEVVRRLVERARSGGVPLPEGVTVVDFGTRGVDLAFALEGCDAAILVDATARGSAPGTLHVIEPLIDRSWPDDGSAHGMTPERVLRRLAPGAGPSWIRIVGCEPESLGEEDAGCGGLSEPVSAAIEGALRTIDGLLDTLARELGAALGGGAGAEEQARA